MSLTGVMEGPISGLRYETPRHAGLTSENGEFEYDEGDRIVFLLGSNPIGSARAGARLDLTKIVARVDGDLSRLRDPGLTNIARLVFSLDLQGIRDGGTTIAPEVHDIIGDRVLNLRHDVSFAGSMGDPVQAFAEDPVVLTLLADLSAAGVFDGDTPRELCSPANARNELRRNATGIRRFRDVRIPLANGSYVLADVFRPTGEEPVPAIVTCGPYGKAFNHHSIALGSQADLEHHELEEDEYFSGNADGLPWENHETVNTARWVPEGYAVVRVDGPGSGNNPGTLAPWGIGTAEAFHDAIEWAGAQPWSNGNVGLWGMSYLAMTQHQVASLHPPHLKAMIAIGTDVDLYEEVAYNGGILNEEFFGFWYRGGLVPAVVGELDAVDFHRVLREHPFKDSNPEAVFGPRSEVFMSPDMTGVDVPLWAVAATTHLSHLHQLGSSEAYLATPTAHKKLDFWEDWLIKAYAESSVVDHLAFFDHWLKGVDNGVMDRPPVRLEIRTGNGASYLQEEDEWPIARTDYTRWYFDATPSDWSGDDRSVEVLRLGRSEPVDERSVTYAAEVRMPNPGPPSIAFTTTPPGATDARTTGVSFVSDPLSEDSVIAGYGKARLWVSSTATDMDLYVSLRVVDEDDHEVDFSGMTTMGFAARAVSYPMAKGWLKVSHRMIDHDRSSEYTVKHTHLSADHAPLEPGETVAVEIEIIPTTAVIRRGQRIRVDVQPYDGQGHGTLHAYDPSYHDGAANTLHTGPDHVGWIQLPVVPDRLSTTPASTTPKETR